MNDDGQLILDDLDKYLKTGKVKLLLKLPKQRLEYLKVENR